MFETPVIVQDCSFAKEKKKGISRAKNYDAVLQIQTTGNKKNIVCIFLLFFSNIQNTMTLTS